MTTIQDGEDIAAAIPLNLVRFERFRDASHEVYRDKPEEFFRILREFILS